MTFPYWLFFLVFLIGVGTVAKRIAHSSLTEWLLIVFILFVGCIIPTGFSLSAWDLTANTISWIVGTFVGLALHFLFWTILLPKGETYSLRALLSSRFTLVYQWSQNLPIYLKSILSLMAGTLALLSVTNLILVLFTPPNEWDSMTGHLNRAIRYIQHGTMEHFGGSNWNMDTYPKSITTIQIYSYLLSGKIESALKLIHYASYWITLVSVFGIAQRIGKNLSASFFCVLGLSLFLGLLLQSISTETDIVLTAYLSCLLYFLFAFFDTKANKYLYLAGMTFGIALGHKITFVLLLPSVLVIMYYTVFQSISFRMLIDRFLRLSIAIILAVLVYTLPTGYVKNMQLYGHPIGPPTARHHQSVERAGPFVNLLKQGSRNVMRYSFDFFNLDGIRNVPWGDSLNQIIRKPIIRLEDKFHLRLEEEQNYTIVPFSFTTRFEYFNVLPYWGVFGFALILPFVLLTLRGLIKSRVHWFLALAILLHFLTIAYSAPYDPFKGRYFIETGVFGALFFMLLFYQPNLSILTPTRSLWRSYVAFVVLLACLSAIMGVFLNRRNLPLAIYGLESAVKMDRMAYQTLARPDITKAYQHFDSLVPQYATVALGTTNSDFEYPLYGRKLTRQLLSINPFEKGLQPIPAQADYLFYAKRVINDTSRIKSLPNDIRLGSDTTMTNLIEKGEDYYLRKLK